MVMGHILIRHPLLLVRHYFRRIRNCDAAELWHYRQRRTCASLPKRYRNSGTRVPDNGMRLVSVDAADIGGGPISPCWKNGVARRKRNAMGTFELRRLMNRCSSRADCVLSI